ncbi:hypothetical protein AVEN_11084-1, partial [Araneus ventricosus]
HYHNYLLVILTGNPSGTRTINCKPLRCGELHAPEKPSEAEELQGCERGDLEFISSSSAL